MAAQHQLETVSRILRGDFTTDQKIDSKIIRIFTSSTFTDTEAERNTLMEKVYPRLRIHCQKAGFEFQVVDMRWGIKDASTDDHSVVEICMKQIEQSRQVSVGPYFIALLGQKYGYRPLPVQIDSVEFNKLLASIKSDHEADRLLLQEWYYEDTNSIPPVNILQPISSKYPHYVNNQEKELQDEARQSWWATYNRLGIILRDLADRLDITQDSKKKYFISVTEREIHQAVFQGNGENNHYCLCFKRTISDLDHMIASGSKQAELYTDVVSTTQEVDTRAQTLLAQLRESKLPEKLPSSNILHHTVELNQSLKIDRTAHQEYIASFCDDYYQKLMELINASIKDYHNKQEIVHDPLVVEILQHIRFCREKCRTFHGRESLLAQVQAYIKQKQPSLSPYAVYGESGSGKTTFMAKVAYECNQWLDCPSAVVVLRFIGITPTSSNLRTLLHSICTQADRAYGYSTRLIPKHLQELIDYFTTVTVSRGTDSKPLIICLDSLDQLSPENGALLLGWLPQTCSSSFKLITSTLSDDQYPCYKKLISFIPTSHVLKVPTLNNSDAKTVLQNCLKLSNRKINQSQQQLIDEAFTQCSLPLYVKLISHQAEQWHSFTPIQELKLDFTVDQVIQHYFQQLEEKYGKIYVSHCLAYITASKNGLTEFEIEDLLSCDDQVLNEIFQYWTPPIRRLPPLIWARLRESLGDYLVERGADGTQVFAWYHRQFSAAASRRYLTTDSTSSIRNYIYKTLADYFSDRWYAGKEYTDSNGLTRLLDRHTTAQPLILTENSRSRQIVYNLRKMSELPYHLIQLQEIDRLKQDILFNFDWIYHKISATSFYHVLDDYMAAVAVFPDDIEINVIYKTMRLSSTALLDSASHLPFQLLGRLSSHQLKQIDINNHFDLLQKLMQDAHCKTIDCMRPSIACLTAPGGALIQAVIGHTRRIKVIASTTDGKLLITADNDKTAKIWDSQHLRLLNKISGLGALIRIIPACQNEYFVAPCVDKVQIWHIESCQLANEFSLKWSYAAVVSRSDDSKLIFMDNDDDHIVVWDMREKKELDRFCYSSWWQIKDYRRGLIGAYKDIVVLYALTDEGLKIQCINFRTDEITLNIQEEKVDVENGCVTSQGQLILPLQRNLIKIYDLNTNQHIKDIPGSSLREFTGEKKHLMGLVQSENLFTCTQGKIAYWNLTSSISTPLLELQDADIPNVIHFLHKENGNNHSYVIATAKGNCICLWKCQASDGFDFNREANQSSTAFSPTQIMALSPDQPRSSLVSYEAEKQLCTVWNMNQQPILILKKVKTKLFNQGFLFIDSKSALVRDYVINLQTQSPICQLQCNQINPDTIAKNSKIIEENKLAILSQDCTNIFIFSLSDGKIVTTISFPANSTCHKVIYSENGRVAVTLIGSDIMAWNIVDGKLIAKNTPATQLDHICLDNQGHYVAMFSYHGEVNKDGTSNSLVHLWNLAKQQLLTYKLNYSPRAGGLALTKQYILGGDNSGDISLWATGDGSLVQQLHGHYHDVYKIIINQHEDRMLTMSEYDYDGTIRLWDLSALVELAAFRPDWRIERSNIALIDHGQKIVITLDGINQFIIVQFHSAAVDENQIITVFEDEIIDVRPTTIDLSQIQPPKDAGTNQQSLFQAQAKLEKKSKKNRKNVARSCILS
ncbi:NACHT and WD repeat domain-containing protein 2 [Trichoplax sp. H2]|nr:NACHT and WD repeat domain-containing protein 2 [Trichoplax sp. H2]|eukprot:RDD38573.1 NACHT and WD repeat domain-containing protein 2 [Trichoplax sp. H2]